MTAHTTQLLRIPDVAAALAVSRRHVLDLIKRGELEAVAIGSGTKLPHYRISTQALASYIDARKVTKGAA